MRLTSALRRPVPVAALLAVALAIFLSSATAALSASASSLTGSWSGTYGGTFSGTFKLNWTQTRSSLRGTITLTTKGQPGSAKTTVTGMLTRSGIKFGTVGPVGVITYTGTVSGSSMSGRYTTPKGGGSWRARKTS